LDTPILYVKLLRLDDWVCLLLSASSALAGVLLFMGAFRSPVPENYVKVVSPRATAGCFKSDKENTIAELLIRVVFKRRGH